jgi:hypothetical protein
LWDLLLEESVVKKLLLVLACMMVMVGPSFCGIILCTETNAAGCIADVLQGAFQAQGFAINVASDGEAGFHPFGATFDTSDAIQFVGFDTIDQTPFVSFGSTAWQQIGPQTWALPADLNSIGCGAENETLCEPQGAWYQPGFVWNIPDNEYLIMSEDGSVSDIIELGNFGPDGSAAITFASDPSIPEPGTMILTGLGLVGAALAFRRKRSA